MILVLVLVLHKRIVVVNVIVSTRLTVTNNHTRIAKTTARANTFATRAPETTNTVTDTIRSLCLEIVIHIIVAI